MGFEGVCVCVCVQDSRNLDPYGSDFTASTNTDFYERSGTGEDEQLSSFYTFRGFGAKIIIIAGRG